MISAQDGPYKYLPASVGQLSIPRRIAVADERDSLHGLRVATLHLRHRRVVHRDARRVSLKMSSHRGDAA